MTENTKEVALPTSFEEIRGFAQACKESGMFSDVKSVAQAIVKITAGAELGLPPVYSMQNINMIRDRLTTSANTMAMLVKKSGRYNYRIKEHTDLVCSITFFEDAKAVGVSTFSMEDAKRANLIKPDSGWIKYPRAMLFSRAISQGARIYCPDAIGGIYTDEEIRSIPPRPDEEINPTAITFPRPVSEQAPKSEAKPKPALTEKFKDKITPTTTPEDASKQGTGEQTGSEALEPGADAVTADSREGKTVSDKESLLADFQAWLKDSQLKTHFGDKTAISWLKSKINYASLDKTGSLAEIVARMDEEQRDFLVAEIEDRLKMA